MTAFVAPSIAAVDSSYRAGLDAGGQDEGCAGPRTNYGQSYSGAYLRDPDGNKIHIAYRGDVVD
jgi:hypothetical protein